MWKQLAILLVIISALPFSIQTEEYKFMIDIGNPDVLCPHPNFTCSDGNLHYLCESIPRTNPKCTCYSPIKMTAKTIRDFLRGTNGLRNKVAIEYKISNMNIVYWSNELMEMAARYLLECIVQIDPCLVIGERYLNLSQNLALLKGELTDRWPGRVVRHWYLELGADVETWEQVETKISSKALGNFSNMIYPLVEFMGCAGAHIIRGHFIVCYYNPPFNKYLMNAEFRLGEPCSNCTYIRMVDCSRTFVGLCGIDYEIESALTLTKNLYLIVFGLIVYMLFVYL